MQKAGVVHRPGLADEMLTQLAPLLAEEGIDLNDPHADVDLDQINAALSYATERHNMELFTPVGDQRTRALETLREISDAVQQGRTDQAELILDAIEPDATSRRPSAAQVIGTSLDLLDSWHSQDPTRTPLAGLHVPRWLGRGRSVAPDLLALARKSRARASLDQLILNHGGLAVAHGGALLVSASLRALAEHDPRGYARLADEYLARAPQPAPRSAAPGSAFGPTAAAAVSSQNTVKEFRRWLANDSDVTPETFDAAIAALEALIDRATAEGIDPHRPGEIEAVLDMIDAFYPPSQIEPMYVLLHDYVDFRVQTDRNAEGWDEARDLIAGLLDEEADGASAALLGAIREAGELDVDQRRSELSELPLLSATRALLDWIGTSRPITQAGAPRRADIATVAAMIGVSAEGVARQPARIDWDARDKELDGPVRERQRVYVQSAKEIPELMAWWAGLENAGVIELTSTRIRPGSRAESLLSEDDLPLDVVDEIISVYVAEILARPLYTGVTAFGRPIVTQTIARLLGALMPDSHPEMGPENGLQGLLHRRTQVELRHLEAVGLLGFTDDEPVVPMALRGPVILGTMMAGAMLESEDA